VLQSLLFERPVALSIVLLATLLVMSVIWSRRRTRGSRNTLLACLAAAPMLLVLQAVVRTDRERIIALCDDVAAAVELGDVNAFAAHIADDFLAGAGTHAPVTRDDLLAGFNDAVTRYHPEDIRLGQLEVTVDGDAATVELVATARVSISGSTLARVPSRWRLRLARRGDAWLIVEVEPVQTSTWPIRNLRDLL